MFVTTFSLQKYLKYSVCVSVLVDPGSRVRLAGLTQTPDSAFARAVLKILWNFPFSTTDVYMYANYLKSDPSLRRIFSVSTVVRRRIRGSDIKQQAVLKVIAIVRVYVMGNSEADESTGDADESFIRYLQAQLFPKIDWKLTLSGSVELSGRNGSLMSNSPLRMRCPRDVEQKNVK